MFSLTGFVFTTILTVLTTVGLAGLFALMAVESFGLPPLPSEVILPFAGVLIVRGATGFTWPTVLLAAVAGGLVGAVAAYEVGRWGGPALVRRWGSRVGLDDSVLARTELFFDRHGRATVGFARLLPVVRAYISYPAGAAKMDRPTFAVYTVLGSVPFCAVLIYLGTVLGEHFTVLQSYFNYLDIVVVVALAGIVLWAAVRWRRRRFTRSTAAPPPAPTAPP
ncbi:MAG: DedA family protein [Thermoplasmata archaeon]|jgi:membrane protein DedA with SNARE-associated domain|nr:DedA family protein [Thermoplasmata archaeon]MCI4341752.1 DedA family protein [Thermoplasmata archaeon]